MKHHLHTTLLWLVLSCGMLTSQPGASQVPDLRAGGIYEIVIIAGQVVQISDVETLLNAGVLHFNSQTSRFSFTSEIESERDLQKSLRKVALTAPDAVAALYRQAKVALPNRAAHTLTIPSGYGPAIQKRPSDAGFVVSAGIGGVSRVPYTNAPDGGLGFSLSFGNSYDTLGARVSVSFNDLSELGNRDRVAFGFELSRYLFDGFSVAVGGENLFVAQTDGQESYYAVASWAFDAGTVLPFDGVATLGVGSGRFADKTPRDVFEGKGRDGTTVFAGLAWEVTQTTNLIMDWNGRNLSVGAAFFLPESGISVKLGLRDLTSNTGDGVRFMGSVGYTLFQF